MIKKQKNELVDEVTGEDTLERELDAMLIKLLYLGIKENKTDKKFLEPKNMRWDSFIQSFNNN